MAKEAKIEQWKASSDGPPWTHTIGSHASAVKTAREMRNDGFSGVHVERLKPASVPAPLLVSLENSDNDCCSSLAAQQR